MSSAEFAEAEAYERLDGPIGPRRFDWRAALVASVVANANRDSKKKPQAYKPDDFIPDWAAANGVTKPPPHPLDVADKMRGFFGRLRRSDR